MRFLRRLNPVPGIKDFWTEFRRPNPHRWPVLGLSMAMTFTIFYVIAQERHVGLPHPPEVTFITTFDPDRTREEIIASNEANEARQAAIAARQQERLEVRRDLYRQLGNATGIDTAEMEREIRAEEARKRAAEERRRAEVLGRVGIEQDEPATGE